MKPHNLNKNNICTVCGAKRRLASSSKYHFIHPLGVGASSDGKFTVRGAYNVSDDCDVAKKTIAMNQMSLWMDN
jgi:hypothetical protein